MHKLAALITACLFLASCSSVNPYNLPEDEGAYLKNRYVIRGKAIFYYRFFSSLTPEDKEANEVRNFPDQIPTKMKIPSGEIYLGLYARYFPDEDIQETTPLFKRPFLLVGSEEDRETFQKIAGYEIYIYNNKYWEGMKLIAEEGMTYLIDSVVEDGRSYMWIEDETGKMVTEKKIGWDFGDPPLIWTNLPDPVE